MVAHTTGRGPVTGYEGLGPPLLTAPGAAAGVLAALAALARGYEAAAVEKWTPLVCRLLKKYGRWLTRDERQDLRQEMRAAVVVACRRYVPGTASAHTGRPVTFMTFVFTGCRRAALNHLRVRSRAGRVVAESVLSAEPTAVGDLPDRDHPGELAWPDEAWRRVARAGRLDRREADVVWWRANGARLCEIAFQLDLSKERVRQIYERAMGKLREHAAAVAAVTDDLPRRGVVR